MNKADDLFEKGTGCSRVIFLLRFAERFALSFDANWSPGSKHENSS